MPEHAYRALSKFMKQKDSGMFMPYSHGYQPLQNPTQVPLNGPLKSTSLIIQQQLQYTNHPSEEVNGMIGEILQVPLTKKQQQSQTVHNFIQYLSDFYDGFQVNPQCLQSYYPKFVQKQVQKKRNLNTDRIVQGIKAPNLLHGNNFCSRNMESQHASSCTSQFDRSKKAKAKFQKHIKKMRMLAKFQAILMQVTLQKIDRRSKPIKRQTKIVSESLIKRKIYLDQEDFDILELLEKNQIQQQAKEKQREEKERANSRKKTRKSSGQEQMEDSLMLDQSQQHLVGENQQDPAKISKSELKKLEKIKRQQEKEKQRQERQEKHQKKAKKGKKDLNDQNVSNESATNMGEITTQDFVGNKQAMEISHSPQIFTPEYCSISNYGQIDQNYNQINDIQIDQEDPLRENHQQTLINSQLKSLQKSDQMKINSLNYAMLGVGHKTSAHQQSVDITPNQMSSADPLHSSTITLVKDYRQANINNAQNPTQTFGEYVKQSDESKQSQIPDNSASFNKNLHQQRSSNSTIVKLPAIDQDQQADQKRAGKHAKDQKGKSQDKRRSKKQKDAAASNNLTVAKQQDDDEYQKQTTSKTEQKCISQSNSRKNVSQENNKRNSLANSKSEGQFNINNIQNDQMGFQYQHMQQAQNPSEKQSLDRSNSIQNIMSVAPIEQNIQQNYFINMQYAATPQMAHMQASNAHNMQRQQQQSSQLMMPIYNFQEPGPMLNYQRVTPNKNGLPDNHMIIPDPNEQNQFNQTPELGYQYVLTHNYSPNKQQYSPNRHFIANEMKYYPTFNQMSAYYANTGGMDANISPDRNQFSYMNHNQMPNCVKNDSNTKQTGNHTDCSKDCSSILHIQPITIPCQDGSNGPDGTYQQMQSAEAGPIQQNPQQHVSEWAPLLQPVGQPAAENFLNAQQSHQDHVGQKAPQLGIQAQIKSVDVNSQNPFKNVLGHGNGQPGRNDADCMNQNQNQQNGAGLYGTSSQTPKAALMRNNAQHPLHSSQPDIQ